jgi:CubicO group peptidase (beta-lactamase class C family)
MPEPSNLSRSLRAALALCLAAVLGSLPGVPAHAAQYHRATQTHAAAVQADLLHAAELEAFIDAFMAEHLAAHDIPGAVLAVVQDGELALARGYGLADLETATPADPHRSLFRAGSVGKLVTWTAVMQQVEQGRLDLHADVNDYLDFSIPDTFPEPITLAHLMAHAGGFEDVFEGLFVFSAEEVLPLRDYLVQLMPARVYAPGRVSAYSNYGTALAGYIVERVSGTPYDAYVEAHILGPLDMVRSTVRQPVPQPLAADLAAGYGHHDGQQLRSAFIFTGNTPAGSLSATAADMARFMVAHLNDGRHGDAQILQPATAQQMHTRHFTADPRLHGMAHGFFEAEINGRRTLSHAGSLFVFNAGLFLLPEADLGLYVAFNGRNAAVSADDLWRAFMDRFYPAPVVALPQPAGDGWARTYAGEYHQARAEYSSTSRLIQLVTPARVSAGAEGELRLSINGRAEAFVEVDHGAFRHRERGDWLVFSTDAHGTTWMVPDGAAPFTFYRAPWYATRTVAVLLLAGAALFLMLSSLAWFIAALLRRPGGGPPLLAPLARWAAAAFGVVLVVFMGGLVAVLGDIHPIYGVPRAFFGTPPLLSVVLVLPWLLAGLAAALAVLTVQAWRHGGAGLGSRIHLSALAVVAAAVLWWLWYWNLWALPV